MIQNIEDLSREREKAVAEMNGYDCRVLVCSGTGCIATGSNKIYQLFKDPSSWNLPLTTRMPTTPR